MRCLKVAFGMENDETLIDAHYGDSEFFAIYEVCEDGSVKLLEERDNKARNVEEHDEGHGDPRKFRAIVSQLIDVDVLAAFRMGPNFLRIRDQSDKVAFFTRTRDLKLALQRVAENFDDLWEQVQKKRAKARV
ncbi:iron-molybdenum cofactor-binding protein [Thermococcus onnurineus NA1]|uniref:Iron-molybdenum cofactor-binding protein n=1 Tax=Thermococcus onnurineus (strain NA1) TaxID=523850 RepID=B6YWE2_THEON|nr:MULTISPECIES: NifB/NifX family molybdenum-iron cluster-binding protein [Thermococcus]ACJ16405.1 iron-molybdenum cofactor-binding protein [Thermococcus onnurineus NA1]NJE47561.1 dinitrogenase iron-molybdenum cofactor [Thermococcus sp. GR7]NJE79347.1 dinitrogenase iron-molybdenum cofactor [Thermococcus sp. GR4]NJF22483.1 dinitrogenase iron-molybdenum cofactor [Thermococcus sp. GR5]